jgi:predicted flap endonuclease-1-like 5' DNA nuclease
MLWYLGAGFLLGWIMSTLTEWLWFRRRWNQPTAIQRFDRTPGRQEAPSTPEPSPGTEDQVQAGESEAIYRPYRPLRAEESIKKPPATPATATVSEEIVAEAPAKVTPSSYPDPLSKVRGIGIVYERRLYEAGIFTWHQLAQTDVESLRAAARAHSTSDPAAWREEAQRLAVENNRVGAVYTGPLPDHFTYIDGLNAHHEQELYQAGILTYAQLAALPPKALARILPDAAEGEEIDFQLWIEQAAQLSQQA